MTEPTRFPLILSGLAPLLVLGLLACAPAEEPEPPPPAPAETATPSLDLPAGADEAADAITADYLREVITELSDDAYEGRGPGTEGDRKARQYAISQLEAIGFEPGGENGSWEQAFDIVSVEADVPETWTFRDGDGDELALRFSDEFIASSGVQEERAAVEGAELVFVGYGIEAPEYDWDDFKGADLDGKMLVVLNNDPDWDDALFEGNRRLYYGRWTYKYESAARQGAAGAIIIHTTPSAGYPWQVVQTSWTGPQVELPAGDEPRVQVPAWVTYEAAEKLFDFAGKDLEALIEAAKQRDFEPVPMGVTTSLELENTISRDVSTANVLGVLRGSDPELAAQAVIYTAHLDHLGRAAGKTGDTIYNGARDNASGVAMVLAIGRAFRALPEPPRRSVLVALVAAEEQGLLGSKYFAQNPTIAPGNLAANVNFDSANIWGRTRDVTYIGLGKSSLDAVVEAAAARQDRVVVGDQFPDRGAFYRSDQFSLAKIGVPAVYFSGGTDFRDGEPGWGKEQMDAWIETHYHQVSDEIDESWNFDGMVEDARLGFFTGLAIAQAAERPAWNPGDEFEAARQEALAALADGP